MPGHTETKVDKRGRWSTTCKMSFNPLQI